ncbi:MAG: energy transducer TonB, partial [Gemmatimonadales bacterium]
RVAAVLMEDEGPYRLLPLAPRHDRVPGRFAPRRDLPPVPPGAEPESIPSFVPRDQEPILRNRTELLRELQERYPPALREAGMEGTAQLYVYVAESGSVTRALLKRSSGLVQLDEVAVEVMRRAQFTPAVLDDEPVGVWIELPVSFGTR